MAASQNGQPVCVSGDVLTAEQVCQLNDCEKVIEKGWNTFIDVGLTLALIRNKRLYRRDYRTFQKYCREKWDYGHSKAYYYIAGAQLFTRLSTIVDIPKPTHEAHVRPLIGLPQHEALKAWKIAVIKSNGNGVTGRAVEQAAAEFRPKHRRGIGRESRKSRSQVAILFRSS